jgi:alanine racemase
MNAEAKPARCARCGRKLTSAKAVANGYGRTCKTKIAKAAKVVDLAEYKAFQVAKAQELIELRAIVRTAPATYLAAATCSCKAGERGIRCYHLAAADILAAA